MASSYTLTEASGVLTISDNFDNTETVTIGAKVYTFQATLTDVDGNVHIAATAAGDLLNLLAAINLSNEGESSVGAGTDYAASMTKNDDVLALLTEVTATTLTVRAKTAGIIGNNVVTTETGGEHAWGAVKLAGGVGDLDGYLADLFSLNQINSEVLAELHSITTVAD